MHTAVFLGGCVSGGRWEGSDLDMIIKYAIFRNGINWSPFLKALDTCFSNFSPEGSYQFILAPRGYYDTSLPELLVMGEFGFKCFFIC